MSPVVTNRLLSRHADILFANGSAYHVELPMAGREAESALLHLALRLDEPRLVTIAAGLGTGKTFFLNKVIGEYANGVPSFDERKNRQLYLATDAPDNDTEAEEPRNPQPPQSLGDQWDRHFQSVDAAGVRLVIVEELDRKATLAQILWTIESGLEWLARGGNNLLVLTGDTVMRHPIVRPLLAQATTHFDIELVPLDRPLLLDALAGRINAKILGAEAANQSAAVEAAEAIVADRFIEWAALPPALNASLATFREALGALRQLAANVPADAAGVAFPRSLLARFMKDSPASGVGAVLESALLADVKRRIERTDLALEPLSILELADLCGLEPDARFRHRGIEAAARLGLLVPLGIPYTAEDERGRLLAYAEPFVPGYPIIHRALAGLVAAQ